MKESKKPSELFAHVRSSLRRFVIKSKRTIFSLTEKIFNRSPKDEKNIEESKEKEVGGKKKKIIHIVVRTFLWLCALGLACFLAACIFIAVQIQKAPDISEIDASPGGYMTTILDGSGKQLSTLYVTESHRIYVEMKDIPDHLKNAFVAIEDSRFYTHNGIDIRGILRAAVRGILSRNFSEGASTITQQLLKNNVLTGWMEEKTLLDRFSRKFQEQYLAIQLEKTYGKEWILENYLNTINLGAGTRGVQVAAQYYFGKDVFNLDLAECALIAGITKNPTGYNPLTNPDNSLYRQHLVLGAMLAQGYITQEEYDEAYAEDVLSHLITNDDDYVRVYSWFEDSLLTSIVEDLMDQYSLSENEAWNCIFNDGLTIYSTLNPELQAACENAVLSSDRIPEESEVSVVMTDVSTGAVVAIVGGKEEKTVSLALNRATDVYRQPGSTLLVLGQYASGFDQGLITLGSTFDDAPYTYSDGTEIRNGNNVYEGMTTVRRAISRSSNIVSLKVLQEIGVDSVYDQIEEFGITSLDADDKYESLAIGGLHQGVSNEELTAAYNAIANDGRYIQPYYYTKVTAHDGTVLLENNLETTQVISPEAADQLTLAMEDVLISGTARYISINGFQAAGKSGTSDSNLDFWFVGYSPFYTCGVWGGCDDNSSQENETYVKYLWKDIMESTHETIDPETLASTALVDTDSYTSVVICSKCGKLAVSGLCSKAIQGDCTQTEYYVSGSEPVDDCDCHVSADLCFDSNELFGEHCPSESKKTYVYLVSASEDTTDVKYVLPESLNEGTCSYHEKLWEEEQERIREEERQAEEERKRQEEEEQEEGFLDKINNWWDGVIDSITGQDD